MDMPLGRKATALDREHLRQELADVLPIPIGSPIPHWLDNTPDGMAAVLELMITHDIYPSRSHAHEDKIIVKWGKYVEDVRVVPINEHESKITATQFAVVLAVISFLEYQNG